MIDLFEFHFFRHAVFMSLLLSLLFGLISFFVVMRRMVFLGAGIAHTAFGGVALGILIGINPFYSSLVFCVLSAIFIGNLVRHGNVSYDTGIGIFFAFAMALGALFIALRKAYTFDLTGYLFGNILGVTVFDLVITSILIILFLPFILLYLQKLLFLTFDEKVANVSGVRVQILDTILFIFLACIIVVSIKIVGIILVSALVVLPASFGLLFYRNYRNVLICSVLFTLCIMLSGLILSSFLDIPTGATMVVLGTIVYFIGFTIIKLNR